MNQVEYQMVCTRRAVEAVCDLADAVAMEDVSAHAACMAARSCILDVARIVGIHVPGVTDGAEPGRDAAGAR